MTRHDDTLCRHRQVLRQYIVGRARRAVERHGAARYALTGARAYFDQRIRRQRLLGALAHFDCRVQERIKAGDHIIYIGYVEDANAPKHKKRSALVFSWRLCGSCLSAV